MLVTGLSRSKMVVRAGDLPGSQPRTCGRPTRVRLSPQLTHENGIRSAATEIKSGIRLVKPVA